MGVAWLRKRKREKHGISKWHSALPVIMSIAGPREIDVTATVTFEGRVCTTSTKPDT